MAVEWTDRMIRGPVAEYLTQEEFRKLFGVSEEYVNEQIENNVIPPPAKLNARTIMFTWRHAVILAARIDLGLNQENSKAAKLGKVGPT